MAIDLAIDTLIEIRRVPDLLHRSTRGKKVSLATIYRWITRDGLPTLKIGGKQYTSKEALQQWAESRTQNSHAPEPQSLSLRQGAVDRAAAEARQILGRPAGGLASSTRTTKGK